MQHHTVFLGENAREVHGLVDFHNGMEVVEQDLFLLFGDVDAVARGQNIAKRAHENLSRCAVRVFIACNCTVLAKARHKERPFFRRRALKACI